MKERLEVELVDLAQRGGGEALNKSRWRHAPPSSVAFAFWSLLSPLLPPRLLLPLLLLPLLLLLLNPVCVCVCVCVGV
jgi:hypothetical protein